jgi:tetratricopeptide (TPR) repeat protein
MNMAVKLCPENPDVFLYRGLLLKDIFPKEALQDLSVSILTDESQGNFVPYLQRALLYQKLGFYESAAEDFFAAIHIYPVLPSAYLNLGTIYMYHLNECDRALEFIDKALIYDPLFVQAYLCRADLYKRLYMRDTKTGKNEQISKIKKILVGPIHSNKSLLDAAIMDYSRTIHLCPWNSEAYVHRGQLLLRKGMYEESAIDLSMAMHLNPQLMTTPAQVN